MTETESIQYHVSMPGNMRSKEADSFAVKYVVLPLLRLYHVVGSPFFAMLGSRCRFYPTCSHYAEQAFRTHGFFRGFALSTIRLAKCNPLHPGGVDHVPPHRNRISSIKHIAKD